ASGPGLPPRVPSPPASKRLERPAQNVRDLVDVLFLGDQRRRDDRRIAGGLEVEAVREQLLLESLTALPGPAVGMDIDGREHSVAANVRDDRNVAQREDRVEEIRRQLTAPFEQVFLL